MAAGCSETFWTKTPPAVGVAAAAALAEGSTVTVTVTMSVTHWTSRARLSRGMAETSRAPAAKRTAEYFILNDGIVFAWSCRCQVELALMDLMVWRSKEIWTVVEEGLYWLASEPVWCSTAFKVEGESEDPCGWTTGRD